MKARNPSTGNLETVYVKALDSMPVGSVVDFAGSSADVPTGWEEVNDYSTTEIDTGKKWIDGKPIYRQVLHYTFTATSSSSSFSESISSLSIDSVISTNPIVVKGTGANAMLYSGNFYLANDNASFVFVRNNLLEFRLFVSTSTTFDINVVLEYTKTTD